MKKPVRVLVVDDSALMRKLIPRILEQDPSIEVVGTAIDGNFALKKIEDLSPQVITLDLEMPGLNGIDTLKEIMRRWGLPVIVVSSHSTAGAAITLKALALGAFDFVAKPQDVSARMPEIAAELIKKIRAAAQSAGVRPQFFPGEQCAVPSEFPPADRTPCSTSSRTCSPNLRAASWWCSTCPKGSPNCLPNGWTNAARFR
jgi:two-component system chemotaxis response regulator CheB